MVLPQSMTIARSFKNQKYEKLIQSLPSFIVPGCLKYVCSETEMLLQWKLGEWKYKQSGQSEDDYWFVY